MTNEENQQPINQVYWLRGQKVMIDKDVAALFQVSLKTLKQRINKNKQRFPPDFMFVPTPEEWKKLQLQFDFQQRIGDGDIPLVLTEAGLLMASGILKSDVAVKISIDLINQFFDLMRSG